MLRVERGVRGPVCNLFAGKETEGGGGRAGAQECTVQCNEVKIVLHRSVV